MRRRAVVTIIAIWVFVFAWAAELNAHDLVGIETWEQEWADSLATLEERPLAPAQIRDLERQRKRWEWRHRCHYHGTDCPVAAEVASDKPKPVSAPSAPPTWEAVERWRGLTAQYFGGETDRALCLMWYESKGVPTAYNPSTASGLMQVKQFWFDAHGGDPFDPANNLRVAKIVRDAQGWTAWSPYNRGLCR